MTNEKEEMVKFEDLSSDDKIKVLIDNIRKRDERLIAYEEVDERTTKKRQKKKQFFVTPYDHSYWVGEPTVKDEIEAPDDLLFKDLQMSRLKDDEMAYIYSIFFSAAQDLQQMGFQIQAKHDLVKLNGKLALAKSVDGFERLMQGDKLSASLSLTPEGLRVRPDIEEEVPEEANSEGGGILSRLKRYKIGKGRKYYE